MKRLILSASLLALSAATPALAETELSFYMGWQTLPHSRVTGVNPDTGLSFNRLVKFEGKPFSMPPYYGLRAAFWRSENFGWALEYTHTKAYVPGADRAALGFDRLEFSDGHNVATVNAMYRWQNKWDKLTPYVGAGVGVAVPHVDSTSTGGIRTLGFQYAGPAVRLIAGMRYDLNQRYALFTEYQFTYSTNDVDLGGVGKMSTDIKTNALNFGISYRF